MTIPHGEVVTFFAVLYTPKKILWFQVGKNFESSFFHQIPWPLSENIQDQAILSSHET